MNRNGKRRARARGIPEIYLLLFRLVSFLCIMAGRNWRGMKGMLISSDAKIRTSKGSRNAALCILDFRAVKFDDGVYWKALPDTSKDSGSEERDEPTSTLRTFVYLFGMSIKFGFLPVPQQPTSRFCVWRKTARPKKKNVNAIQRD